MKIEPSISLPFYEINSETLKILLNVKKTETVVKRLGEAGVQIKTFGTQRVVLHQDLIAAIREPKPLAVAKYRPKTDISEGLQDLDCEPSEEI